MTAHVLRAMRVLVPNDLRLIWRDGFFLILIMFVLPIAGLALRYLVPVAGELVAEWVVLEPYYGLIVASALVGGQPILLGFVIGLLFVEERDEGTLLALQASPLSLRSFLAYRMLATMGLNVVLTCIGVLLSGLVSLTLLELLAATALASLTVPMVALVYAVYIKNKVQALMLLKPLQIWGFIPTLLYFAPIHWQWFGSLFAPVYYSMRLFWTAAEGQAEWGLILPALIIHGIALLWLLRRLERTVYA